MSKEKVALSPYMGYFILKVNGCKYYIYRIINPAKEHIKKDAIHELNKEDLIFVGLRYDLYNTYGFIRQHKKNTNIDTQTFWDMQTELINTSKECLDTFWAKTKKMGIEKELKLYLTYPVETGPLDFL